MQKSECSPLRGKRAQSAQLFTCDPTTKKWQLVNPNQGLTCNPRSPHQIDPRYECSSTLGQFKLSLSIGTKLFWVLLKGRWEPYFLWMKDHREQIKKESNLRGLDLSREMGRRWREVVSDDEKQFYKTLSEEDKLRYGQQLMEYKVKSGYKPVMEVIKKGERRPSPLHMVYIDWYKREYKTLQEEGLPQDEIVEKLSINWQLIKENIIQQINQQIVTGNELKIDYPPLQ